MSDGSKTRSVGRHAIIGSIGTIASRVSGLVREVLFAAFWGTGSALGAFIIAFTIPNLFRRVLGEGAMNEAFVPLFNEKLERDGRVAAYAFAGQVLSLLVIVLAALAAVVAAAALLMTPWFPEGLAGPTLKLVPVLMPYMVCICTAALLAGILNSLGHFTVPAFSPVILNACLIAATVWLCPRLGEAGSVRVYGLAWAVLVAGVLQVLLLLPLLCGCFGFTMRWAPPWRSSGMGELWRLLAPGLLGAGVYQLNVLCDRGMAGWLGGAAVTSLWYSERLVFLPIGVFAVAISVASLPVLSRASASADAGTFTDVLTFSFRQVLFWTLPCALVLMVLGPELIDLVYLRGAFGAESARETGLALMWYVPGIPAFASIKIIRSGFLSRKDPVTPLKVGACCVVLNLVLNLILMQTMRQGGLALATTISAWLNVGVLSAILIKRLQPTPGWWRGSAAAVARMTVAVGAGCGVILIVRGHMTVAAGAGFVEACRAFVIPAAAGVICYGALATVLGAREGRELLDAFRKR